MYGYIVFPIMIFTLTVCKYNTKNDIAITVIWEPNYVSWITRAILFLSGASKDKCERIYIFVFPNKSYVQIAKPFSFGQDIWNIRSYEISFSMEYVTIKTYVHNPK